MLTITIQIKAFNELSFELKKVKFKSYSIDLKLAFKMMIRCRFIGTKLIKFIFYNLELVLDDLGKVSCFKLLFFSFNLELTKENFYKFSLQDFSFNT